MGKDKKKDKKGKKSAKADSGPTLSKRLKAISDNPLVADVVAAALVATASALKDSDKARRFADQASDELEKMSKQAAQRGNAMWQLALDVGRRSLEALAGEDEPRKAAKPKRRKSSASKPAKGAATKGSAKKKSRGKTAR